MSRTPKQVFIARLFECINGEFQVTHVWVAPTAQYAANWRKMNENYCHGSDQFEATLYSYPEVYGPTQE